MNNLRLLIVDDEPIIRLGIRSYVAKIAGVTVVGECGRAAEAVEAILSKEPNVVFLDVQLPDATGLEVVECVGLDRMPLVVFVTAFDAYAVKAFELNAIDYLLKPFDKKRLQKTIARARERLAAKGQSAEQLEAMLAQARQPKPKRLVVRNGSRYEFVPVETIDWIESANNYVELHCGKKVHLMNETLAGLEQKLDRETFVRVHRCRIVNVTRVMAVRSAFDETYEMELRTGDRLSTGRQFKKTVQSLIGR